METTEAEMRRHPRPGRIVLAFAAHQIVATFGVMVITPFVLALFAPALRLFGLRISLFEGEQILTGLHYFPLQIAFGFLLGCVVCYSVRHHVAQWVWVLPAFIVLCLVVTNHHVLDLGSAGASFASSPISHYFGNGCSPQNHCLDQILVTLPLYSAVAYSLGAYIGRSLRDAPHGRRATSAEVSGTFPSR